MERITAIILAAGTGSRMNSNVHKQYMSLMEKPVLYYSLNAFEKSRVTDIVLVTGAGEEEYCRREIVERYNIQKVSAIVEGGKERYHSVYEGLKAAEGADYVLIHDGARPLVTEDIIARSIDAVRECRACVAGMPVKDTIKVVDEYGVTKETPDRSTLWLMQTPQSFSYTLISDAYKKLLALDNPVVTDDAMVLEKAYGQKVRVIKGSYRNIKITTPEDLIAAEAYLKEV